MLRRQVDPEAPDGEAVFFASRHDSSPQHHARDHCQQEGSRNAGSKHHPGGQCKPGSTALRHEDDHRVRDRHWDRGLVVAHERQEGAQHGVVAEEIGRGEGAARARGAESELRDDEAGDGK
jgi:hypothetical protein